MSNVTIQSRVSAELREEANAVFSAMGLTTSDAIRMFLQTSVNIGGLPFHPVIKRPNHETAAAIEALESGKGRSFTSLDALLDDLDDE